MLQKKIYLKRCREAFNFSAKWTIVATALNLMSLLRLKYNSVLDDVPFHCPPPPVAVPTLYLNDIFMTIV